MARQHAAAVSPARSRPRPQIPAQPRPKPRAAPKRKPRSRGGVAGGLAWIVVAGVLLAGIVALNVAVLRLNLQLDRLNTEREKLHADAGALASQVSSASSSSRIQALARARGFVPAHAATFVELRPRRR